MDSGSAGSVGWRSHSMETLKLQIGAEAHADVFVVAGLGYWNRELPRMWEDGTDAQLQLQWAFSEPSSTVFLRAGFGRVAKWILERQAGFRQMQRSTVI